MKKLTLLIIITLSFSQSIAKEADLAVTDMLTIGKITGICGILISQADFKDKNPNLNAKEFFDQFWAKEIARTKISLNEYLDICEKTTEKFERITEQSKSLSK